MSAPESDDFVIQVWDISRAHQHCKLQRKVFIRLPEEDPRSGEEGVCGLLVTALNGVRVGVMHHGDDFVAVGPRRATPKVGEALSKPLLGPRAGDLKQIRVLNRTLTWKNSPPAIEYTADKRRCQTA
eukprot:937327-Amphidinium_carterae.1